MTLTCTTALKHRCAILSLINGSALERAIDHLVAEYNCTEEYARSQISRFQEKPQPFACPRRNEPLSLT